MINKNNKAFVAGEIITEPTEYECCGEKFYSFVLASARESGVKDEIPVNISVYLLKNAKQGDRVAIIGQIRTYNKSQDGKNKLIIKFFGQAIGDYTEDTNQVELTGHFCKKPNHRVTPLGRDICDVLLAVNRERGKSDYIPCIVWGRTAQHIGELSTGTKAIVAGRFQSRKYEKKVDGEVIQNVAYEVSVNRIADAEETEE